MPDPGALPQALSPRQAAAFIERRTGHRPHPSTVWRWILKGRLPAQQLGSRRFILVGDIDAMLRADGASIPGELARRGREAAARLEARSSVRRRLSIRLPLARRANDAPTEAGGPQVERPDAGR